MDRYVTDIKMVLPEPGAAMDFSDPDAIRVGGGLLPDLFQLYLPAGVRCCTAKILSTGSASATAWSVCRLTAMPSPPMAAGTWAPALRYHAGRFYAFIPLPDEGIFYTEATDPRRPLECAALRKIRQRWIDPCPLWDDDGSVYMAHAFAKSRCGIKHKIQLSRLDPETLEVVEDGPIVFDGTLSQPTAEGPKMYKRNGWYYIFIPAGGVEYGWQTVLRARNVYGPYEEKIVMHQGPAPSTAPTRARGSQRRTARLVPAFPGPV